MLPNPCYQTSMRILGGASGGPVFNAKGKVIGINSTGFQQSTEDSAVSFVSDINETFNIILEEIETPSGYIKSCTLGDLLESGE